MKPNLMPAPRDARWRAGCKNTAPPGSRALAACQSSLSRKIRAWAVYSPIPFAIVPDSDERLPACYSLCCAGCCPRVSLVRMRFARTLSALPVNCCWKRRSGSLTENVSRRLILGMATVTWVAEEERRG